MAYNQSAVELDVRIHTFLDRKTKKFADLRRREDEQADEGKLLERLSAKTPISTLRWHPQN